VQFDRALRAEVRDALWFLTRQWQFGEFKGEDAGSPVEARTAVRVDPLQHYAVKGELAMAYDPAVPLETHVGGASESRSTSWVHAQVTPLLLAPDRQNPQPGIGQGEVPG